MLARQIRIKFASYYLEFSLYEFPASLSLGIMLKEGSHEQSLSFSLSLSLSLSLRTNWRVSHERVT